MATNSIPYAYLMAIFLHHRVTWFLFCVLHLILTGSIIVWAINRLAKMKIPVKYKYQILIAIFFGFMPPVFIHNIIVGGDTTFSVLTIPLIIFLAEIICNNQWIKKPYNYLRLVFVLTLCVELRRNAIILVPFIVIILVLYARKYYKHIIIIALIPLIYYGATNLAYSFAPWYKGHQLATSGQMYAIPLQLASSVFHYGGYVPPEELEYFTQIKPAESWKNQFAEYRADAAWTSSTVSINRAPSVGLLKHVANLCAANKRICANTYNNMVSPLWANPMNNSDYNMNNAYTYFDVEMGAYRRLFCNAFNTDMSKGTDQTRLCQLESSAIKETKLRKLFTKIPLTTIKYNIPVFSDFFNIIGSQAHPFYCILLILLFALWRRRFYLIALATPLIVIFLTYLVFIPVVFLRYISLIEYMIPFLVAFALSKNSILRRTAV